MYRQDKKKLFSDDFKFGLTNEVSVLEKLQTIYPKLYKTKNEFSHFDFRCDENKIDIELKSRRIAYKQYPTIFFAEHKLHTGRKNKKNGISNKIIYCFEFKDKSLYFWEDDGNDTDYKKTMCGNYKNKEEAKPLIELYMDKLKPISELVI